MVTAQHREGGGGAEGTAGQEQGAGPYSTAWLISGRGLHDGTCGWGMAPGPRSPPRRTFTPATPTTSPASTSILPALPPCARLALHTPIPTTRAPTQDPAAPAVAQHVGVGCMPRLDLAHAHCHHPAPVGVRQRHHHQRHPQGLAGGACVGQVLLPGAGVPEVAEVLLEPDLGVASSSRGRGRRRRGRGQERGGRIGGSRGPVSATGNEGRKAQKESYPCAACMLLLQGGAAVVVLPKTHPGCH